MALLEIPEIRVFKLLEVQVPELLEAQVPGLLEVQVILTVEDIWVSTIDYWVLINILFTIEDSHKTKQ